MATAMLNWHSGPYVIIETSEGKVSHGILKSMKKCYDKLCKWWQWEA
jgi:hypothetical protein